MSMFCYQLSGNISRNLGCTMRGVCGKSETLANLFDLLIYGLKGRLCIRETAGKG